MGQRGQLDRLPVAHAGPILTLNWFIGSSDREKLPSVSTEGWVATGGSDRCVKVHLSFSPLSPYLSSVNRFGISMRLQAPITCQPIAFIPHSQCDGCYGAPLMNVNLLSCPMQTSVLVPIQI
jgi:hypothetical protein